MPAADDGRCSYSLASGTPLGLHTSCGTAHGSASPSVGIQAHPSKAPSAASSRNGTPQTLQRCEAHKTSVQRAHQRRAYDLHLPITCMHGFVRPACDVCSAPRPRKEALSHPVALPGAPAARESASARAPRRPARSWLRPARCINVCFCGSVKASSVAACIMLLCVQQVSMQMPVLLAPGSAI